MFVCQHSRDMGLLARCLLLVHLASSYDVLVISNVVSISHSIWFDSIAFLLADSGHQVVYLDREKIKEEHENITHFHMAENSSWRNLLMSTQNTDLLDTLSSNMGPTDINHFLVKLQRDDCRSVLASPWLKRFLKEYQGKRFDLIVMDFLCTSFFGLGHLFGDPPLVMGTPFADPAYVVGLVGHYDNPSYVPVQFTLFSPRMSFSQRLLNSVYTLYGHLVNSLVVLPANEDIGLETFGPSVPPPSQLTSKVSMVLVNTHFALDGSKPIPPSVIPVPGIHINTPKPLPKKYQTFLDRAEKGVIFFSFGSNVQSSLMTKEKKQMFIEAFRELPQRVLWKLEEEVEDLPENIMTGRWLPQNDILGHPNVKCFISHGGLLGTQEAIYHGVPILGIPFMFDQSEVLEKMKRKGIAIKLNYNQLTKEVIKRSIKEILYHPRYQENIKEWSRIFKDTPQTPKQKALFWLEYVIRNKEISHLRSASAHLSWYQLLLLDVLAVAVIFFFVLLFTCFMCISTMFRFKKSTKIKIS